MSHTDVDRPSPEQAGPTAAHPRGMTLNATGGAGTSTLSRAKAELVLLALDLAQRTARVRPETRNTVKRLDRRLDHVDLAERVLDSLARWWCGM